MVVFSLILPLPTGYSLLKLVDNLHLSIHQCIHQILSLLTYDPPNWSHHTFKAFTIATHSSSLSLLLPPSLFTSLDRSVFVQQPLPLLYDRAFPPFFVQLPTFFARLPSSLHTLIVFYEEEMDTTYVCTFGRICTNQRVHESEERSWILLVS
ncbi:hypothetical protein F4604DRAFT_80656 [Suillus subluteus]|nr:hypothetical protein F4604DRAFT_80656 [Suillus subluteus]